MNFDLHVYVFGLVIALAILLTTIMMHLNGVI